jgi:phosphoribosylanthranilate isomerase
MFIKICANTNMADAQLAAELGADAVGFVFAPSKRRVTAEQVAEMTPHLPAGVEMFGVFAMDDPYGIEHFVACSGLTGVQLHGAFDAELVRLLSREFCGELKIIQTVAYVMDAQDREAADARFEAMLRATWAEPAVWAVLLDAAKGGASGGLGTAFDWEHVAPIVRRVVAEIEAATGQRPRLIVAGGLRAENVTEAIAVFAPWGVDVASGVEAEAGKKDPERLRGFIAAARAAFAKLEG